MSVEAEAPQNVDGREESDSSKAVGGGNKLDHGGIAGQGQGLFTV